jgi:hypothetical protein
MRVDWAGWEAGKLSTLDQTQPGARLKGVLIEGGRSYSFDSDGGLLRLASEAYRIRLAHLFDPYLAVTASQIEALPHQITAVYGEMCKGRSKNPHY